MWMGYVHLDFYTHYFHDLVEFDEHVLLYSGVKCLLGWSYRLSDPGMGYHPYEKPVQDVKVGFMTIEVSFCCL